MELAKIMNQIVVNSLLNDISQNLSREDRHVYKFDENAYTNIKGTNRRIVKYLDILASLFCCRKGDCVAVGIKNSNEYSDLYVSSNTDTASQNEYICELFSMITNPATDKNSIYNYVINKCSSKIKSRIKTLSKHYGRYLPNGTLDERKSIKEIMRNMVNIKEKDVRKIVDASPDIVDKNAHYERIYGKIKKLRIYTVGLHTVISTVRNLHINHDSIVLVKNDTIKAEVFNVIRDTQELGKDRKTIALRMHAEMRILSHINTLEKGIPKNTVIGISKLACYLCEKSLNEKLVLHKGTHKKVYGKGWIFPAVNLGKQTESDIVDLVRETHSRIFDTDSKSIYSDSSADSMLVDESERDDILDMIR